MKHGFIICLVLLVCSCSGNPEKAYEVSNADSNLALDELIMILPKANYPTVDSTYLARPDSLYVALNGADVVELVSEIHSLNVDEYLYNSPSDFLKLDSIKTVGQYENYLEKLDIAMVRDARAFAIQKTNLKGDFQGLLWGISYSSYEACPAYSGTDLFLSFFAEGNIQRTLQVGSNYAVIDPPSAFTSIIHSHFEGDNLFVDISQKEIELGYVGDEETVLNKSLKQIKYNYINDRFYN